MYVDNDLNRMDWSMAARPLELAGVDSCGDLAAFDDEAPLLSLY